jgi:hypothetical protein
VKRAIRTVLRLIASGFVVFGGMQLALEFVRHRLRGSEISLWQCSLGAIFVVLGLVLFGYSARIAQKWADDFE